MTQIPGEQDRWRDQPGTTPEAKGARWILGALRDRSPRPRARRLVTETYGATRRGAPDTARAAADLGVSRRTVQRWVKDGLPARSAHAEQLRRSWADSPAGRRAAISPARVRGLAAGPSVAGTMDAHVWVSNDRRNGMRRRFGFAIDGPAMAQVAAAMRAGDDAAAHTLLAEHIEGFGGSVDLDIRGLELH